MLIVLNNFKSLLILFLHLFMLVEYLLLQYFIFNQINIIRRPIKRQIGISCYLKIWKPKTFFSKSHLVGYKKYKQIVLITIFFHELFNFLFINFPNPTSLKLLLINRNSYRDIQITLIQTNVFLSTNSDKLTLFPISNRPFYRLTYYSIFLAPFIKSYIFLFLLNFSCYFPIWQEILNRLLILIVSYEPIMDFLCYSIYYFLSFFLRYFGGIYHFNYLNFKSIYQKIYFK